MRALATAAVLAAAGSALPALSQETGPQAGPKPNPAAQIEAPSVDVVSTTPLPGIGVPISEVPANVQSATGEQIRRQGSRDLPEYLNDNVSSVTVNESQGNAFQPDISYRGFTVSPLLGVPQGLSVFQDGVRINEPLGDMVNWDLIPQGAISSIALIPGSNPVFGLNTLGGSLSINTKSGREYPGGSVSAFGGSFGTYSGNVEYGGAQDDFDYYIYGNGYHSDGWREHSSSLVRQAFGKVGYQTSDFDADLSYSFADNTLFGIQTLPAAMLSTDRRLAYTWPDSTDSHLNFVDLRLSDVVSDDEILAGNVYWRELRSTTLNSNVNGAFDGSNDGTACDGTTPGTLCPGSNIRSMTDASGAGGTLQLTLLRPLASHRNSFTAGASYDHGSTTFTQSTQNAVFDSSRDTIGVGPFAPTTGVASTNAYTGLYFTDTFSLTSRLLATLAGRYDTASIRLSDELGASPGIDGTSTYRRFNPALGLNYNPSKTLNTYISYNQGMRAPTPVELTCANPAAPCPLPNAFLSDPPLQAVIAKTVEMGGRGALASSTAWSAALYRSNLDNDIQFVSTGTAGVAGFFTNIPQTRRQGLELSLKQRLGPLTLQAAYAYVDATYQSSFFILSPNNTTANASGNIQVQPGDRLPGIPRHNFKLRAEWQGTQKLSAGATLVYSSSRFAIGNENNQDPGGSIPGYAIVNLDARYQLGERLQLFARIVNLFDRNYQTAGILGRNFFTGSSLTYSLAGAEPSLFSTPGAPFGIWAGLRYEFGKPPQPRDSSETD